MTKLVPIILCGGIGSRLWPLSRSSFPKQYLNITSGDNLSFFQKTLLRIINLKNICDPIIVCNEEHRFIVAEQLRNIKIQSSSILLEPLSKNTAPAITTAVLKGSELYQNPCFLVLPSDHLIKNIDKFNDVLSAAIKYCDLGKLVTFGINPTKAETGYGYIEAAKKLCNEEFKAEKIIKFIEKPEKKIAQKLFLDKKFSWNSGIFLFKGSTFINEIKNYAPKNYEFCKDALEESTLDLDFQRLDRRSFALCENISIDKAIMEKTKLGYVFPLDVGWNDIGSWESLWEEAEKDENGNVISGKVLVKDVQNSYLRSEERVVVGIGLENLIIVETIDSILVIDKKKTQMVKGIVQELQLKGFPEAKAHKTVYRPWGKYTSLAGGNNWQVKIITVEPGEKLSLQLHNSRAEHWVIVDGTALVEINKKEKILKKNESAYIPLGAKHRLSNPGNDTLILIEVQSGSYLGEDDIIRFNDKYGRNK